MVKSYEELKLGFDRIAAAQECRNLMGRYSYLHTASRNIEFMNLWADREDDLLVMPWGYYKGKSGVVDCYVKGHGDRSDPRVLESPMLKGGMMMHAMDTCVVEVASDGKTAKGCWISPGHESMFLPDETKYPNWNPSCGPVPKEDMVPSCEWAWSKYQADFILEGDQWKFWKMRLWPIYKTDFYVPWTQHPEMEILENPFDDALPLPEKNWEWSAETVYPANEPEPPLPYRTYADAVPVLWEKYE